MKSPWTGDLSVYLISVQNIKILNIVFSLKWSDDEYVSTAGNHSVYKDIGLLVMHLEFLYPISKVWVLSLILIWVLSLPLQEGKNICSEQEKAYHFYFWGKDVSVNINVVQCLSSWIWQN